MSVPREDLSEEIAALTDDDGNINGSVANGRFATESTESAESSGGSSQITPGQCSKWRRRLRESNVEQQALAGRADVEPSTVHYHVRGGCGHEVDEPVLEGSLR